MQINIPESIDLSHPEHFTLAFRISRDRFIFSLYNPQEEASFFSHTIEANKHTDILETFKDTFFENDFFALPYNKTIILNNTPSFTFVPLSVFEEKDKERYFNFNFSGNKDRILSQKMTKPEMAILYNIREDIYEFFLRSFANPIFYHHLSPLISYFQERSEIGSKCKMIINIKDRQLDILCFAHGEFIFGNQFTHRDINDINYYILYIWKQLKLDQLKDFIYVTGNFSSDSKEELCGKLEKYIKNVIPVHFNTGIHLSGIHTESIPVELLTLSLCEL